MNEGKLIEVKFRDKLLPIKEKTDRVCICRNVEVDLQDRTLSCEKCGAIIDPFDYILDLAYQERNIHSWIEMITKERDALMKEKENLKQQVSRLRSEHKKLIGG